MRQMFLHMNQIDWNELWKRAILDASWMRRRKDPVEFWNRRSEWYNEAVTGRVERTQGIIAKLNPDPECMVLDIGSGPGTFTIPIAKIVKHATAIDISKGMLTCLRENAKKEGVGNITCINKKWEDVELGNDIEEHDIVIASYSLFAMLDIKEALLKMDRLARKTVYLLTSAGEQTSNYNKLWPKLYGEEYVPSPDYIYIVNVLYQIGISANVEILEYEYKQRFSSLDEAVEYWLNNFDEVPPGAEEIVREYIAELLIEEEDAFWSKQKTKTAMIWWQKEKESEGQEDAVKNI